jgi:hypothetical protein
MRTLLVALGFATFDQLPSGAITHTGYIQFISDGEHFHIAEVHGVQTRV